MYTPTTDSGACIDHAYCNCYKSFSDVIVDVKDVYYSDHDMVLLSFQLDQVSNSY